MKLLKFLQSNWWLHGFPLGVFVIVACAEGNAFWVGGIGAVLWLGTLAVQHIKIKE